MRTLKRSHPGAWWAAVALLLAGSLAGCTAATMKTGAAGTPWSGVNPVAQASEPAPGAPRVRQGQVVRVVDGDTVHVVVDGVRFKVRLIGIDTPESTRDTEPFGDEASRYARSQLDGRTVWLETDAELYDRYDRLLAYVWLDEPTSGDGPEVAAKMFNAQLVARGYAQIYTFPPNVRYADVFLSLQRAARERAMGLWGVPGAADPLTGRRAE